MILASSILVYFSSFFFITFKLLRWVNYIFPPKISNCPRFILIRFNVGMLTKYLCDWHISRCVRGRGLYLATKDGFPSEGLILAFCRHSKACKVIFHDKSSHYFNKYVPYMPIFLSNIDLGLIFAYSIRVARQTIS